MKRALVSVSDKTGIVEFCKRLKNLGWEIITTGGTFRKLEEAGIEAIGIEEVTDFPEILDGRVKTLNPFIFGGILFRRDDREHKETVENLGISPIDMVVNNLYPFEETLKNADSDYESIIENIDIGGPSIIRAAAKNYKFVTCIVDHADYEKVLSELEEKGEVSVDTNKYLARKVFNLSAYYDCIISDFFDMTDNAEFPDYLSFGYKKKQNLRYGENPHQKAAFYESSQDTKGTLSSAIQHHGKELSFNNINDANGALEILKDFEEPTAVAVKHSNPCGIGSGETVYDAYIKAYECDTVSIFGGILAFNRTIDSNVARRINEIFIELIIAPGYTEDALQILKSKKNIRILEIAGISNNMYRAKEIKKVLGGLLIQDRDRALIQDQFQVVSKTKPDEKQMEDILFAWKAIKGVKSNGVVIAKDKASIGIGQGEVNRIWAVQEAIDRSGSAVKGAVIASDGFFPFSDSVEILAKAGIAAIIQPGGSIKDQESIDEADKHGIVMIFTGTRHFKH